MVYQDKTKKARGPWGQIGCLARHIVCTGECISPVSVLESLKRKEGLCERIIQQVAGKVVVVTG